MNKQICVITEKNNVLSMDIDTDINTALNAFVLFAEVFYNKAREDCFIEDDAIQEIMRQALELVFEENK